MNAINLLDGIDGLATVLGIVLAGTFAVMALLIGRAEVAVVALVFTGALVGFAWLNLPPASIFLGDAGSMLIGLLLGILAIKGSMKGPGTPRLLHGEALSLAVLDLAHPRLRGRNPPPQAHRAEHLRNRTAGTCTIGSLTCSAATFACCCLSAVVAP